MSIDYDVVVIGAGFGGLYSAHKMRDELGLTVKGFDAAGGPGGTWWWNRYPGARCDIESVHYSYSFSDELQRGWEWTERFAAQLEILAYLEYAADTLDVRKEFTFNTRVTSTVWEEATSRWTVTTDNGATCTARFVIAASGNLSLPKPPEFPGLEDFAGEVYTTSNWPQHEVDFSGKRVGVIGTGSTGIQAISTIAPMAGQMTVFQRTANFAAPLGNEPVDPPRRRWLADNHAEVRAGSRDHPFGTPYEMPLPSSLAVSADERRARYEQMWQDGGLRLIGSSFADILFDQEANDLVADFIGERIRERVTDPRTANMLIPTDHPYGTKRPPLETNYYETFNRDNVELVDVKASPIQRVSANGIQTVDREFPLDMIILATGFDALTGPLLNLGLVGRDGVTLTERWTDGPHNYLGIAVNGFPNLFTITGPTSAVALYNNPLAIEDHVEFAADAIRHVLEIGAETIEATAEAVQQWHAIVDGLLHMSLVPKANSWYMGSNVAGKPRATSIFVGPAPLYRAFSSAVQSSGYGGFQIDAHTSSTPPMMKLDAAVANLAGILDAQGAKSFEECTIEETRATVEGFTQLQGPARDVEVIETTYPAATGDLPVRIYIPDVDKPLPVLVYFHGGGFIAGSIEANDKPCRALAEDIGAVVIAPSYRLAPEHLFPAATDDTYAALRWAAEVADEYGGDPTRIVVAGESSGGNLAAVAAQRARDENGPAVMAQVLITPAIDAEAATASRIEYASAPFLSAAAADHMWQTYLGGGANARSPLASPNRASTLAGLPPALIITAECDPLRDEAEDYGKALAEAGVRVAVERLAGLVHGSINMGALVPRSREYTDTMVAYLHPLFNAQLVSATRPAEIRRDGYRVSGKDFRRTSVRSTARNGRGD